MANFQIRRKFFTPLRGAPLPDLTEVQKTSYQWFLQTGLKELFEEVSPIKDFIGRDLELYFSDYYLDEPKFDENTSRIKNVTYEAPLRVHCRLINKRNNDIREQEIYLGDVPLMTDRGTFIINGIERAVVSQLVRASGVLFTSETHHGRRFYGAKMIPNRGAWLELETDQNGVIWVRIDRKRKVTATSLLRAFGWGSDDELKQLFRDIDTLPDLKFIEKTLGKDASHNEDEGLVEVYKKIRPGDLATIDNARSLIYAMFFRFDRYDLGRVGRYVLNRRFKLDLPIARETRILRKEDLVLVMREIIRLNITQDPADDIDHLGNRRVRCVGELLQNRFRIGLARMERIIRDRMSTMDVIALTPNKLINARPVIGVVREFFMSSQCSQFMDQTNPMAELEHKRRLSALGPGGLSRERAGLEVRDVHPSHYGRICPIATPEGPNVGLVAHLACYARINEYGFIETPYRVVKKDEKGRAYVSDEMEYMDAWEEEQGITTPATTPIDERGYFLTERTEVRSHGRPTIEETQKIDYMDVGPYQIISVATGLIPFLEHNDGARALMGTNMQRQAVPCVKTEPCLVGTGLEEKIGRDSGYILLCEDDGTVVDVDSSQITITEDGGALKNYPLKKFLRSNASTCINQHPVVEKGQQVQKGDVLADGPAAAGNGEIALGQNVLVAFLSWEGYSYEDAIVISRRLVENHTFSSIYLETYSIDVRETKLGPEVTTNDIPNVSEERLKHLDKDGVIHIGAEVRSGDILIGKITPKGETELSAEEKLLRAIFGEKARDVRDTSLYLEHGEHGKVIDVRIFSQDAGDKLAAGVYKSIQVTIANLRKVQVGDKLAGRHGNKGVIAKIVPAEDMPHLADGTPIDVVLNPLGVVSRMNLGQIYETHLGWAAKLQGYYAVSPPFAGITEEMIEEELKKAGLPADGKITLYDGRNGEPFDHAVTVGYATLMKLVHMVEDKVHQRSIGPYSLITQQPLGGRAQSGGQRFGEMEVWALEGYGAANTLQEILTIKSDDISGRSKAFESIIKGESIKKLNIPESFHVLTRELKGLALDVELLNNEGKKIG